MFEADGTVGGIAKTIEFNGFRFDLGGHRFFTKLQPVEKLWQEMLGDEFLTRPRLSRIYYDGKYFDYPITAKDVVARLGLWESTRCALSYLWAARHRNDEAHTFEEWVTTRFGRRLYDAFFRSYTEKVWGIPGSQIRSLWAAQRIKNFSLGRAILTILGFGQRNVTTLIEEFQYPRLGPGQMWEAFAADAEDRSIPVYLKQRCVAIKHSDNRVTSVVVRQNGDTDEHCGRLSRVEHPAQRADPQPRPAGSGSRAVGSPSPALPGPGARGLMTSEPEPFPDNWIYLHDPGTRAGRVQNYGVWSDGMVRAGHDLPRGGVLLLRGRRDLEHDRRAGGRACQRRARARRPHRSQQGYGRREGPRSEGVSDVRPTPTRRLGRRSVPTCSGSRISRHADGTGCIGTTTRTTPCGRRFLPH